LDGWSRNAIVLELDRHGYKTSPTRRGRQPKPFDGNRIGQILDNQTYAARVIYKGEDIGGGNWPAFVAPEDFDRLKSERASRARAERPRRAGVQRFATCWRGWRAANAAHRWTS
jgi:hypothetical protein